MLSWFLQKKGKTFIVVDDENRAAASRVSAGIIHPITGRRIVKTWLADQLIPFAENTYKELEIFFGEKFYHPIRVIELLSTVKEYNDWMSRSESPELDGYLEMSPET